MLLHPHFLFYFCFLFYCFFFPQLPTLLSIPSSPSTALGGSLSFFFCFLFYFLFFPQLPTLLSMPSSPPTVLGGSALLFFCFLFYFLFFPQLPTLFPPGKGPFASLARLPVSPPPTLSTLRMRSSILILPFTYRLFGSACLKTE